VRDPLGDSELLSTGLPLHGVLFTVLRRVPNRPCAIVRARIGLRTINAQCPDKNVHDIAAYPLRGAGINRRRQGLSAARLRLNGDIDCAESAIEIFRPIGFAQESHVFHTLKHVADVFRTFACRDDNRQRRMH
jgi:hypothetical protein